MKILIIDDAQYILDNTAMLLEFEGYEVDTAHNGVEGVEKAFADVPDLILCDVSMPQMDGFEVLKKVRANPATTSVPFIFLSAFADTGNVREGMNLGSDDYIVKPFTRNVLLASIKARIKRRELEDKKAKEKINSLAEDIAISLPHEFRTVLNEILNSANQIKEIKAMGEYDLLDELAANIIHDVYRIRKITDNFIMMARVQAYKKDPISYANLKKYITENPNQVVSDISHATAERNNRREDLVSDCPEKDIKLKIVSEHFYKICYELIDNAFAYSDKGSKIHVSVRTDDETSSYIINIADKGRGMSDEQLKEIYAFHQFDRKSFEQQGIGLGLALSKDLVEIYGGKFNIISNKGEGTIVTVSLPFDTNA